MTAGGQLHRQLPLAERIFAEFAAKLRWYPGVAAIGRDLNLLDALAAVEGDALQHSPARPELGAIGDIGDEGADGEAVDRYSRLRCGARLDAVVRRVWNPVGGFHPV